MSDYPEDAVVRVEDFGPIERAYAEAMHEDCPESPEGHSLAEHSPWSGGDLDGTEPWPSFMDRLARHGLRLVLLDQLDRQEAALRRIAYSQESDLTVYAKLAETVARAALSESTPSSEETS